MKRGQNLGAINDEASEQTLVMDKVSDHISAVGSKWLAGLFSLLIPLAHAMEINEPIIEPGVLFIETAQTGIYRVSYEELLAAGVDLSGVDHTRLSLTNNGNPVYLHSWGQGGKDKTKTLFGPGAGFEFIAQQYKSLYSKKNVYTLHISADSTQRLEIQSDSTKIPKKGSTINVYTEITRVRFNFSE